jgi:hypothetical protein
MKKYPLIGGSIIAVFLLILGSLTNVVGFQAVQSSNQKTVNDRIDQKKLLFQTILDIANNKEIQKTILNSEIRREGFFNSDVRFSRFTPQVLTKTSLKHMYLVGLMLSKIISKSKIHSMVERYQVNNQGMQKEISAVIEKDVTIKEDIAKLSDVKCDCKNENTTQWEFPILCTFLLPFLIISIIFYLHHFNLFIDIMGVIGGALHCSWA